jgi:uncharacterized protein YggE
MRRLTVKKIWFLALGLGLAVVLVVVGLAACTPGTTTVNTGYQQEGIWVNGQGKVSAAPDMATLQLGIEAQADSVAQAQSEATRAMEEVVKALKASGVAEKDIQTMFLSIQKITAKDEYGQGEITTGFSVTNTVVAKIRNVTKVGEVIDAVVTAGGDLTRIDGISFSIDDPTPYLAEARAKAMADAKAKAEQLASLSGVTLGKLIYIQDSSYYYPPTPYSYTAGGMAAPASVTPISPGELDINGSVQVAYAILK